MIKEFISAGIKTSNGKKLTLIKETALSYLKNDFRYDIVVAFVLIIEICFDMSEEMNILFKIIIMFKIKSLFKNV
jgi:hypothetical protein